MSKFSDWGNDLYSGKVSINVVGRRKVWYTVAAILIGLSILLPIVRGGFNFGIEFRGGSEFRVSEVSQSSLSVASSAVKSVIPESNPLVTTVGLNGIRVQTEQLSDLESEEVRIALAEAYGVDSSLVASSFIGANWGADITAKAIQGLVIFLVLVTLLMALYFRTVKMSLAALVALLHDVLITIGVYGALGIEITPAAIIGLLTILGYSLYDTVVVFDKVRENTLEVEYSENTTFASQVNLAVNQTMVRSINTSVVAVLPVAAILFIGAYLLGAGTLRDIALALFVGMIVGTFSSIFIASPVYVHLREREQRFQGLEQAAESAAGVGAGAATKTPKKATRPAK